MSTSTTTNAFEQQQQSQQLSASSTSSDTAPLVVSSATSCSAAAAPTTTTSTSTSAATTTSKPRLLRSKRAANYSSCWPLVQSSRYSYHSHYYNNNYVASSRRGCGIGTVCGGCLPHRIDVALTHSHFAPGLASYTVRSFIRALLQVTILTFIALILVLWLGAEYEAWHIRQTPNTNIYYNAQTHICAMILETTTTTVPTATTTTISSSANVTTTTTIHNNSSFTTGSSSTESELQQPTTTTSTTLRIATFDSMTDLEEIVPDGASGTNHSSSSTTTSSSSSSSSSLTLPLFNASNNSNGNNNNTATATSTTRNSSSSNEVIVAHCGDCGACSTPPDIAIYDATRNTLLKSSTRCAKHALIWGRTTAAKCLEETVGFTQDCNDCWIENIMCDLRKCIFTCIWYGLFKTIDASSDDTSDGPTALNPCTACDEQRCGPAFVQCAGANRRRSGIMSDIQRDSDAEVCHAVHPPMWWTNPTLQRQWHIQQQQQQEQLESSSSTNVKQQLP